MNYNDMTKEELIQLIEDNESFTGKYGLIWDKEKEPEKIVVECDKNIPVLSENKKLSLSGSTANNILIEGDNFHSLSILNYTHNNMVDLIYIDPPYNTGNEDFIYNDKYVNTDDGYRHSKWLNFMYKRLKIARNLMKDDGIIFISIDDNELYQLKLLCDKVFGENNFISTIVVESGEVFGTKAAHVNKTFVKVKDYVLVYSKNRFYDNNEKLPLVDEMRELYDSHYGTIIEEDMSTCSLIDYLKNNEKLSKMFANYNFDINKKNINVLMGIDEEFKNIMFNDIAKKLYADAPYSRNIPDDILSKYSNNQPFRFEDRLLFKTSSGSIRMYVRMYENLKQSDDYISKFTRCTYRGDLWKGFHFDMRNIDDEGKIKFKNGKKPVRLIKQLLKWANKPNAIVLDFFAGSGTTGQAVYELNKEDGGNRRFIICTNNENNICREITYNRFININQKDLNLKYYECNFVENSNNRDQLYFDLTEKCIPMMCIKDNNFIEYKITDEYKIYTNEDKSSYTCVYYSLFGEKENEFVKELESIEEFKSIYKFSLGDSVDYDILKNVKNYKIEAIPYRIVELYKRIVKMSRED